MAQVFIILIFIAFIARLSNFNTKETSNASGIFKFIVTRINLLALYNTCYYIDTGTRELSFAYSVAPFI
jgi:hypothetical protein